MIDLSPQSFKVFYTDILFPDRVGAGNYYTALKKQRSLIQLDAHVRKIAERTSFPLFVFLVTGTAH